MELGSLLPVLIDMEEEEASTGRQDLEPDLDLHLNIRPGRDLHHNLNLDKTTVQRSSEERSLHEEGKPTLTSLAMRSQPKVSLLPLLFLPLLLLKKPGQEHSFFLKPLWL